jgi:hypothetical protein
MRLPFVVSLFGYLGLIPFLGGPLWITIAMEAPPPWLDAAWLSFVALIASFMAGSFWGFALPACEGPQGTIGLTMASVLMGLTWVATTLPFDAALFGLIAVFLLLLAADLWRERTLGTIDGYFRLRTVLTLGAVLAMIWRLAI